MEASGIERPEGIEGVENVGLDNILGHLVKQPDEPVWTWSTVR
jgi:hypothetical protein